ncbi:hypothetical protein BD410DRAFT_735251, partial [Rickenella mellea]
DWLEHRGEFLDELLCHDGVPNTQSTCHSESCSSTDRPFRCRDCFGGHMHCSKCLVDNHRHQPLHRIERWTGSFFERTTLAELGLCVQLGHGGDPCMHPEVMRGRLTVLDVTGIHQVKIAYCHCEKSIEAFLRRTQLLRAGWFPATLDRPMTVITFDALDLFHALTLQSKITFYDFYHTLLRRTDNSGIQVMPDAYKAGMRCVREYRHLLMLKRSGIGHAAEGIDATKPGSCAVECPACPHPDRNLPDDWQDAPANDSWLYTLILSVDANFRLKLKDRGFRDPELGSGWSYFVESDAYLAHLADCPDQEEINECDSRLHAIDHANSRFQKGYVTTGVGCVVCARHTLVRKNGVGDLQKGEKYVNMDYILLSTLVGCVYASILLTYDIACQWSKNFFTRVQKFPVIMQINTVIMAIYFAIPKFHLPAHGSSCHSKFSLNFRRGVGRTDGEGVERDWAHINAVATSTREMGPGSRHSTLDDHWGAWNWRKVTLLGVFLLSKLKEAIENQAKQRAIFADFSATFSTDQIAEWDVMITQWEQDKRKPDPYSETEKATTLADIRLELAKEDTGRAEAGQIALHNVSPSSFIFMGLELEEQQAIRFRSADQKELGTQGANLQDRRNGLKRRIDNWKSIQALYMPGIAERRDPRMNNPDDDDLDNDDVEPEKVEQVESVTLWLPSQVPRMRDVGCISGLHDMEFRFREAQAEVSLRNLRRQLRMYERLLNYKTIQVSGPGQKANTRARALLARFHHKTKICTERYRAARLALSMLKPGGNWQAQFKVLLDDDLKGPKGDEEQGKGRKGYGRGTGEGYKEPSWIWSVQRGEDPEDIALNECLRVEYAKSKARIDRWDEEVRLVAEEMRRTVAFLQYKSKWWFGLTHLRQGLEKDIADGVQAYACKQGHLMDQLAKSFCIRWYPYLSAQKLGVNWMKDYIEDAGDM